MELFEIILYIAAFGFLWLGSNLIVTTISSFTRRIRVPPFVFSFFIVGILTSVGEIAVAINAVSIHKPEIFVGSLLGGTFIIFALILPLMAILSKKIHIQKYLTTRKLFVVLAVIAVPAFFILDQRITTIEAVILIALYAFLFLLFRTPSGTFERVEAVFKRERKSLRDNTVLRIALGALLIFTSSRYIVDQTINLSGYFHVSTFLVSLVIIAIGMNLPELTLAVKAGIGDDPRAKDIAVGDLLGSAAANVAIFGVFSLINNGDVVTAKNFIVTFIFIVVVLACFFIFNLSKQKFTRKKALLLIVIYMLFVVVQYISK